MLLGRDPDPPSSPFASQLLGSFSDTFLHIPDPGSVGPFMVNLLAATRATARIASIEAAPPDPVVRAAAAVDAIDLTDAAAAEAPVGSRTAAATVAPSTAVGNRGVLILSPASAVQAVPGRRSTVSDGAVHVPLGAVMYDQPRHIVLLTHEDAPPLRATVRIGGATVAQCAAPTPAAPQALGGAAAAAFDAQVARTAAACALELQEQRLSVVDELGAPKDEVAARVAREGGRFGDVTITLVWNDESDLDVRVTLPSDEVLYYGNKKSKDGLAELDIDNNAGAIKSKEPVENVFAGDAEKGIEAPRGHYKVQVHNFKYHSTEGLPEPRPIDFKVSVRMHGDVSEYGGTITSQGQMIDVCEFDYGGRLEGADAQTQQLQEQKLRRTADKERLAGVPTSLLRQATELVPDSPLKQTLTAEALLAVEPNKFATWGRHYLVTLPQMLLAERRSNFRDAALQDFGQDAEGRPAFLETLSSEAELCFAQLAPPPPSGLERLARKQEAAAAATATASSYSAPAPRHYDAMPEEFMRGGGCFAPDACVRVARPSQHRPAGPEAESGGGCVEAAEDWEAPVAPSNDDDCSEDWEVPIAQLAPGTLVRTPSGGTAAVRCIVASPCDNGIAILSELPTGLQLTEWHPIQDAQARWVFPNAVGRRVVRRVPAVYNLVLEREHVAIVNGVACVTLGHGLVGPVIGHPFYGTSAVIEELSQHADWPTGRVTLSRPLRAPLIGVGA